MQERRAAVVFALTASLAGCEPKGGSPIAKVAEPRAMRLAARPPLASTTPLDPARQPVTDECAAQPRPEAVALSERVTMAEFWGALSTQIALLDSSALRSSFEAFAAHHGAPKGSPELWRDFTRLWVVFEATRDGGWWRLRWDVTDQEPSSVKIWKAWFRAPPAHSFAAESAVAECDEITALFAVTARRLGVRGVGLFYPTWNHVIAGWSPEAFTEQQTKTVVLIPTTQIFQGCPSTFDQTTFKPPRQVYEFPRVDIKDNVEMPAALATFLLEQVRAYGEASPELLALIRAKRAELLQSSLGDCDAYRRELVAKLRPSLSCADKRALRHLVVRELGQAALTDEDALAFLASP